MKILGIQPNSTKWKNQALVWGYFLSVFNFTLCDTCVFIETVIADLLLWVEEIMGLGKPLTRQQIEHNIEEKKHLFIDQIY